MSGKPKPKSADVQLAKEIVGTILSNTLVTVTPSVVRLMGDAAPDVVLQSLAPTERNVIIIRMTKAAQEAMEEVVRDVVRSFVKRN